ncbi:MAG: dethiobiotin synthase [Pirellulaceae bacterium]|nr:dethiobiotin synthase [Pirellulaceae bacterium]
MKFLDDWMSTAPGQLQRLGGCEYGDANSLGKAGKRAGSDSGIIASEGTTLANSSAGVHGPTSTRGLFVIGTDTDVGKTFVSVLLIRHLVSQGWRVGAYKPVASGVRAGTPGDAERLLAATGQAWPLDRVCPQSFADALAPPIAAAHQGQQVDDELLRAGAHWWLGRCDALVVEGAGGALSPLSHRWTVLDLAQELALPVVLVAQHRLGMMNHVLLTLEALQRRQLPVLALVINQLSNGASTGSTSGVSTGLDTDARASDAEAELRLEESLACLLPFCGKISCWVLQPHGSTLFQVGQ